MLFFGGFTQKINPELVMQRIGVGKRNKNEIRNNRNYIYQIRVKDAFSQNADFPHNME